MNDTELIQQTLQGNPIAFGRLMERYYDKVLLYTASLLRDYFEAEEVTQDAFLRGYHRLRELKDPNSFLPWMIRIAHNMALKRLRRRRDLQVISIEELEEEIADDRSFEDELLRREAEEIFYDAMEGLCEDEREMLWGWLKGESYRELSERYGRSIGAVKMRVKRAKEKVREEVLRRLSGLIILPWRKVGKMIGGVVMKATTKVAITGAVVLMLGGTGIWMTMHRGDENPVVKPSGVKVERRMEANVSSQKDEKEGESDDLTFEEFNAFLDSVLDEYFGGQGEETVPSEEVIPSSSSGEMAGSETRGGSEGKGEQEEIAGEEIPEELRMAMERIDELDAERERLRKREFEILDEKEELYKLRDYYAEIGDWEERRKVSRRIYELGKYGEELSDAYHRAWDEIYKLFDIVEEYALQGNPTALKFLKEKYDGFFYKRALERIKQKEGGE
ncbi:sigma-70 family RNA polymerase sigma factor [Candidatus Poribacteria bacterium]|nr:sigma-70 family RNA polymerase sigma factor [Candidatus Poribacteria bacterium]